jgi:pSer/pThr/pTyr-binding forkhead associated (FHA) protein
MKAKLVDMSGGHAREILINNEDFLVGRGEDCDLTLHDAEISRHHCTIRIRGGEAVVSDLGSSNGTFVNGHRIVSQATVRTGDEVKLGTFRFLIDLGDDPDFQVPTDMAADPLLATRQIRNMPDLPKM